MNAFLSLFSLTFLHPQNWKVWYHLIKRRPSGQFAMYLLSSRKLVITNNRLLYFSSLLLKEKILPILLYFNGRQYNITKGHLKLNYCIAFYFKPKGNLFSCSTFEC